MYGKQRSSSNSILDPSSTSSILSTSSMNNHDANSMSSSSSSSTSATIDFSSILRSTIDISTIAKPIHSSSSCSLPVSYRSRFISNNSLSLKDVCDDSIKIKPSHPPHHQKKKKNQQIEERLKQPFKKPRIISSTSSSTASSTATFRSVERTNSAPSTFMSSISSSPLTTIPLPTTTIIATKPFKGNIDSEDDDLALLPSSSLLSNSTSTSSSSSSTWPSSSSSILLHRQLSATIKTSTVLLIDYLLGKNSIELQHFLNEWSTSSFASAYSSSLSSSSSFPIPKCIGHDPTSRRPYRSINGTFGILTKPMESVVLFGIECCGGDPTYRDHDGNSVLRLLCQYDRTDQLIYQILSMNIINPSFLNQSILDDELEDDSDTESNTFIVSSTSRSSRSSPLSLSPSIHAKLEHGNLLDLVLRLERPKLIAIFLKKTSLLPSSSYIRQPLVTFATRFGFGSVAKQSLTRAVFHILSQLDYHLPHSYSQDHSELHSPHSRPHQVDDNHLLQQLSCCFQHGLPIDIVDSNDRTPLYYVVEKKHSSLLIIRYLLSLGANPNHCVLGIPMLIFPLIRRSSTISLQIIRLLCYESKIPLFLSTKIHKNDLWCSSSPSSAGENDDNSNEESKEQLHHGQHDNSDDTITLIDFAKLLNVPPSILSLLENRANA